MTLYYKLSVHCALYGIQHVEMKKQGNVLESVLVHFVAQSL